MTATTATTVTLSAIFGLSWAIPNGPDLTDVAPLPSFAIGLSMAFVMLAIPAYAWGWMVARIAHKPTWPIIRTTLRVSLPTFAVVGIAVDLSQIFIDSVMQWHHLAVHGLFALSFAVGMAAFTGIVVWRVARVICRDTNEPASGSASARIGVHVAMATGSGVIAGALIALPLDWAVVVGMGRQMLSPLYLVLATGTSVGGFVFGHWLTRAHEQPQPT